MIGVLHSAEGLAGVALIGLVLSDVFRSVVLPRATPRSLRLGPLLGRLALAGALAWARWPGRGAGPWRGGTPCWGRSARC